MCITCYNLPTTENNLCLVEASKEFVNYTHGNIDYVNYGSIPRYHNNGTRRDIGVIIGRYYVVYFKGNLVHRSYISVINIPGKFGYYCGLSKIPKYVIKKDSFPAFFSLQYSCSIVRLTSKILTIMLLGYSLQLINFR